MLKCTDAVEKPCRLGSTAAKAASMFAGVGTMVRLLRTFCDIINPVVALADVNYMLVSAMHECLGFTGTSLTNSTLMRPAR